MKRIIALLLLFAMCISLISCDDNAGDTIENDPSDNEENETISLTEDNFFDYFAVQLEYEDLRLEMISKDSHHTYYDSVCELDVRVDNITSKTPNKVSITLTISIPGTSAYGISFVNKTITIPANGSYSFKQSIRTKAPQKLVNFSDVILQPIAPSTNEFTCKVTNISGTMS